MWAFDPVIISLQNKGINLPTLSSSFFFSAHPNERACHPERSAPQARGAKDLLFDRQVRRAERRACPERSEGACPERSEGDLLPSMAKDLLSASISSRRITSSAHERTRDEDDQRAGHIPGAVRWRCATVQ
jgi:hypothetical protein